MSCRHSRGSNAITASATAPMHLIIPVRQTAERTRSSRPTTALSGTYRLWRMQQSRTNSLHDDLITGFRALSGLTRLLLLALRLRRRTGLVLRRRAPVGLLRRLGGGRGRTARRGRRLVDSCLPLLLELLCLQFLERLIHLLDPATKFRREDRFGISDEGLEGRPVARLAAGRASQPLLSASSLPADWLYATSVLSIWRYPR